MAHNIQTSLKSKLNCYFQKQLEVTLRTERKRAGAAPHTLPARMPQMEGKDYKDYTCMSVFFWINTFK